MTHSWFLRSTFNRLMALVGAGLVMGGTYYYYINQPEYIVSDRMWEVKARFLKHYAVTRKIATSVHELPPLPQLENHNKDPWGFPFQLEEDQLNRRYCVVSMGNDGAPGGEGTDRDLRGCFLLHESDGSPANPFGGWDRKKKN
ncbi:MAG: type II secretion system protein GspG [Bdellovibrionales bacterium]|nr:type II secretion system protein GspG [Bdellovibrionales bacterium]